MMAEDDLDLCDAERTTSSSQQMHDDLYDGLQGGDRGRRATSSSDREAGRPTTSLTKALVEGMRIVGEDFRDGILFVPEVLLSANAMKAGMFILRPLLVPRPGRRRSARW